MVNRKWFFADPAGHSDPTDITPDENSPRIFAKRTMVKVNGKSDLLFTIYHLPLLSLRVSFIVNLDKFFHRNVRIYLCG